MKKVQIMACYLTYRTYIKKNRIVHNRQSLSSTVRDVIIPIRWVSASPTSGYPSSKSSHYSMRIRSAFGVTGIRYPKIRLPPCYGLARYISFCCSFSTSTLSSFSFLVSSLFEVISQISSSLFIPRSLCLPIIYRCVIFSMQSVQSDHSS